MKTAVCVKYIPVLNQIKFDYEQKTIVREGVPSEINPFDLLGLVRAVEMKDGPEDEVVVISMGPPHTREGLMECLALGADRAVLLTDRALAGSDTLATARALAMVLAKEEPDLIICGRKQHGRGNRPGGAGDRRVDGHAPRQPGTEVGPAIRRRRHIGRAGHR